MHLGFVFNSNHQYAFTLFFREWENKHKGELIASLLLMEDSGFSGISMLDAGANRKMEMLLVNFVSNCLSSFDS